MLCSEGAQVQNQIENKDENENARRKKNKKISGEGSSSFELNAFKNPKTWKKSISNFFRNQLRSTKSIDGDRPSGSKENYEDKEITTEQKWQSLGKIFRRQSFAEHWNKSPNQQAECSSQNKRLAVRKVFSSYFSKTQKPDTLNDEN